MNPSYFDKYYYCKVIADVNGMEKKKTESYSILVTIFCQGFPEPFLFLILQKGSLVQFRVGFFAGLFVMLVSVAVITGKPIWCSTANL